MSEEYLNSPKLCKKCGETKFVKDFHFNSKCQAYHSPCKLCLRKYYIENKHLYSEKAKADRKQNPLKYKTSNRKYYLKHREEFLNKCKIYREKNKDSIAEYKKEYGIKNKEILNLRAREFYKNNKAFFQNYRKSERGKLVRKRHYEKNKDVLNKRTRKWRSENPEHQRFLRERWKLKNIGKVREIYRKKSKRQCDELRDCYIKQLVVRRTNIDSKDVPDDVIKFYRAIIEIKRLLKEKKQCQAG